VTSERKKKGVMLCPSGRRHRQLPAASRISACSTSRKAGQAYRASGILPLHQPCLQLPGAPDAPHLQASCGLSATFLSGPPFLVLQPRIPRSESWGSEREKEKDPPNSKKGGQHRQPIMAALVLSLPNHLEFPTQSCTFQHQQLSSGSSSSSSCRSAGLQLSAGGPARCSISSKLF
jgi:hypothetical protein